MAYKSKLFSGGKYTITPAASTTGAEGGKTSSAYKSDLLSSGKYTIRKAEEETPKTTAATTGGSLPSSLGGASIALGAKPTYGTSQSLTAASPTMANAQRVAALAAQKSAAGAQSTAQESAFQGGRESGGGGRVEESLLTQLKKDFLPSSWSDFGKGLAYNAERVAAGLLGAGENVTDFLGTGFYKALEDITSLGGLAPNAVSQWSGNAAEKFLQNSVSRDYEQSIQERYDPSKADETMSGVAQNVAQVLLDIAAGKGLAKIASGGGALMDEAAEAAKTAQWGKTVFGTRAAGGGANEAYSEGADAKQALQYGAASGAMEVLIESISGGIPGLGEGKLSQVVRKVTENPVASKVLDILGEGGEEGLSAVLTPYIKRAVYNKDAETATAEEIAENVILGIVTSGLLQGLEIPGALSRAGQKKTASAGETGQATDSVSAPETAMQDGVDWDLELNRWNLSQPVMVKGQNKTAAADAGAGLPKITMADFTDVNSQVWNNVAYEDTQTQNEILSRTRDEMISAGEIVTVPTATTEKVSQSYPDLRTVKKSERTPILREKVNELKASLRQFLNELKGSYEFEVNGSILEARLYDTGIREVMEKVTQDKASMLYHSDQVFQNARYLYSTPDYEGNPNIYRWNYFYTPVQIGEETVDVRIAVRDMVRQTDGTMDSQIYNWNIKKDASLDDGSRGPKVASSGVSSDASTDAALGGGERGTRPDRSGASSATSREAASDGRASLSGTVDTVATSVSAPTVPQDTDGVKSWEQMDSVDRLLELTRPEREKTVDWDRELNRWDLSRPATGAEQGQQPEGETFGENTVGAAQARFDYQEAPTQSVGTNLATEQELEDHPKLQNTHRVYTNAQSRFDAETRLANDYEGEKELLKTEEWGAAEHVAGYQILSDLMDEARETGDYSQAIEWKKLFDRKGTEAGQALQARVQFAAKPEYIEATAAETLDGKNTKRMSDKKKQTILNEVRAQAEALDGIAEGDTEALISLIERNNEIRRTTGLFAKKTAKQMDWALRKVSELYPDTSDSFLRAVALSQINSIATDYEKLSPLEAVKSYRMAGMLSKVSTVMRNLVSNQIFDPLEALSGNVGMIADGIMAAATGQRTTAFDASWLSSAKRQGSLEGALKSYIQVGLDANVEGSGGRYEEAGSGRTFKMTGNFVERLLSTWAKYGSYALTTTDEFQKGGIVAETQRGIDRLKAKGELSEDALEGWAEETAKQRTLQNNGKVASALVGMRNSINKLSLEDRQGGSFGPGDFFFPFARVPANLVSQTANYSPLGLANSFREMVTVMLDAKRGDYSAEKQAQAARDFGRGISGTALLAGFTALAASGLIDVAGADDEDKEALEKAQGRTGTQWNLSATQRALTGGSSEWQDGDTLMSIGFLDPLNAIMAAGSLLWDAYSEDDDLSLKDVVTSSGSSLFQAVLDLPAMSAISDLMDAYTYADGETVGERATNALLDYAGSQASSFLIPNAVKGIATGLDNTVRNQYTGTTVGEDVLNSLKAGTPGARSTLPAALDVWGNEKTQTGSTALNMLNNNILPGALTKYRETEVERTLDAVYDATGESGIYPDRNAPSSFSVDNVKFTLDAEQKIQYMSTAGSVAEQVMTGLIDSEEFQDASDADKASYLALANEYARAMAKKVVTDGEYKLGSFAKGASEAEELGIDIADYIMYYGGKEDYDADGSKAYSTRELVDSIEGSGMTGDARTAMYMLTFPKWTENAEKFNVSFDTYVDFKLATEGLEGDKDKNGETISGSLKKKVLAAINGLKISGKEKDKLYLAAGYGESGLKDAPWH